MRFEYWLALLLFAIAGWLAVFGWPAYGGG